MDVIKNCITGLFVLLVIHAAAQNQHPQFYFDKPITLDSLTRYVHSHSTIRFSFNSLKVKGDKVINLKKGTYTIGALLQEIRRNTSLYYRTFNGYVIFQDNPPKQKATTAKVTTRKTNNLSHHKPVAKPVTQTPAKDTTKVVAHTKPDSVSRTVAPVDTAIARRTIKDTTAARLLLTNIAGKAADNDYIDVVKNTNGQVEKGKPAVPVYNDSAKHPWVKDTMKTQTKVVRADVSKKDGRKVATPAPPARNEKDDDGEGLFSNWQLQFGLHWKATVPINGFDHYLTGPNNTSQFYNPLIPGLFLSAHNEHHEILVLVKPAEWTTYNNNVIKLDSTVRRVAITDSTSANVWTRHTTSFIKSGGMYAGLQYNYHINEHFLIGAGIGYQMLGQTLGIRQSKLSVDTARVKVPIPDTLFTVKGDSLTNRYLNSYLIQAKFEVAYKLGQFDLGAAVVVPLTKAFTSSSKEQKRPLNVQVFVRWRLKHEEETD